MRALLANLAPELMLTGIACILFLLGCSNKRSSRQMAPFLALIALVFVLVPVFARRNITRMEPIDSAVVMDGVAHFIRALTPVVAILLVLLAWPTNREQTGNSALDYGNDGGEFFALFLLSIAGLMLVSVANDLILLFLALELVSIPTYIMVSISRPAAVAQEAGVKYFFLGALSVALMLFGFSYLFGATGEINMPKIGAILQQTIASSGNMASWQKLGVLLVILGLTFKMAAFPLHFYAGDVYEGAATPVTAFLAFVPKTAGFVALIKILAMVGGSDFALLPRQMGWLLWALAALSMTVGNVLGLLQSNVKRVLAYSSIAHTGYMLVGAAALARVVDGAPVGPSALSGILFYLAAYGLMNAAAFGVLMLLPSRDGEGSAETFDDLAGQGRRHVGLGLAMAVACFSLIGIPLTVGFVGKVFLIVPALRGGMTILVIILVVNAAISAAYYLRIVATLFLRPAPTAEQEGAVMISAPMGQARQPSVLLAVIGSVVATLIFGTIPQATELLLDQAMTAAKIESSATQPSVGPMASLGR
ncbi:MAG TPA: NADH-quinone oxidoreductase subunit N [Tepidisphaeraceae bacterium]|nr:NADH-quinone oxidoreductase subunit N [Tepidisphaeraceae bacterium]